MELPPIVRASSRTVTDYRLRTSYRRLHPDIWIRRDLELDATTRAVAAWAWSRQRATLTGYSAAAIWGAKYLPSTANAELVIANRSRPPDGITIRRRVVRDDEKTVRRGFCVTIPLRTAFDLCRDLPESDAVEAVDALYQATGLRRSALLTYCRAITNLRGVGRTARIVELTDEGAESIWETRTRLFIVRGGLPRPESQVKIYDRHGELIGRFDLVYRAQRLIIEYDGDQHFQREQRNKDVTRWNALGAEGWRVIRVKASQLLHHPDVLLTQIREALEQQR